MDIIHFLFGDFAGIKPEEYFEPEKEVDPMLETVLGEMTEAEKIICTMIQRKRDAAIALFEAEKTGKCDPCDNRCQRLLEEGSALRDIQFILIRNRLNAWKTEKAIGLRRGYKIVTYEDGESEISSRIIAIGMRMPSFGG